VDVDSRRYLVDPVDVADDLLDDVTDVLRADEDRSGSGQRLSRPLRELGVAADRVLELGSVCLDRIARAGPRGDGSAEENVVGEDEVGRQVTPQGRRVQLDVALTLDRGQLR